MITWIKLEPVPLKEKIYTANLESQVNQMIAQIKQSYVIPEGMEIENGIDGVLIGSNEDDPVHEKALEKIILDYPTEWNKKPENEPVLEEEAAFFDSSSELKIDYKKTVTAFDFINFYAIRRDLFDEIQKINNEQIQKIQKDFFDPVEEVSEPSNITPFKFFTPVKKVAEVSTDLKKIEELYNWIFDNSNITAKLKPLFHILKLSSLSIPIYDFVNSFENAEFRDDLREFCLEENLYSNDYYLIWKK